MQQCLPVEVTSKLKRRNHRLAASHMRHYAAPHTFAYGSICQHTSAYVSISQRIDLQRVICAIMLRLQSASVPIQALMTLIIQGLMTLMRFKRQSAACTMNTNIVYMYI